MPRSGRRVIAFALAMGLSGAAGAAAPAMAGKPGPGHITTLTAPWSGAWTATACRQYDDVFGPSLVPATDPLVCNAEHTASAKTGEMVAVVSATSASFPDGTARGDAFPNSVVLASHRLRKPVPAVRFTFEFDVPWATIGAIHPHHDFEGVLLIAEADRGGVTGSDETWVLNSQLSPVSFRENERRQLTVELRAPAGDMPAGRVDLSARVVSFVIVATPPLQAADTQPSDGYGYARGHAKLTSVRVEELAS